VDGRSVKPVVDAVGAYKDWVAYWRWLLKSEPHPEAFLRMRPGDNFTAEWGGEILSSDVEESPEALLDSLYRILVEDAEEAAHRSFEDEVDHLLTRAGLLGDSRFHLDYSIDAPNGERMRFPYVWVNGHVTVANRLALWRVDRARALLWEFSHLPKAMSAVVFTREAVKEDDDQTASLLEKHAHLIAVENADPDEVIAVFEAA
jgi:hypothetical protein